MGNEIIRCTGLSRVNSLWIYCVLYDVKRGWQQMDKQIKKSKKGVGCVRKRLKRVEHWHVLALFMIVYDIVAVHVAYFMALWSRFDFAFSHIPDQYYVPYRRFITAYSLVCVMVFWLFGLYKTMWRFASYT